MSEVDEHGRPIDTQPAKQGRNHVARLFLVSVLALVLVSVMLPSSSISWMRHNWLWFTYPLDWIESTGSVVNLVHAILFLMLGAAMRAALRQWSLQRTAVVLTLLGVATELAQLLVPGRTARVTDVLVDIVAGLVGWLVARRLIG